MVTFNFTDKKEEKSITLPDEFISAVKEVVKKFPVKYADGNHFVKVAIYTLYTQEMKEYKAQEERRMQQEQLSKPVEDNIPQNVYPGFPPIGQGNSIKSTDWNWRQ